MFQKFRSRIRIFGLFGLLTLVVVGTGCGGSGTDAPLVSIPAPTSLSVSTDLIETSGVAQAHGVVMVNDLAEYAGCTLTVENASGESDEVTVDAAGRAGPARVLGTAGDSLTIQLTCDDGESDPTTVEIPSDRVSAAQAETADVEISTDDGLAYILGDNRDTAASTIKVIDLITQDPTDIVTLTTSTDTTFTDASELSCFSDSNFCVVLFQDSANTIVIVDRTTGEVLDSTTHADPNDEVEVYNDKAYVSSTGTAGTDLLVLTIDPESGSIESTTTIDLALPSGIASTASLDDTLMTKDPESGDLYLGLQSGTSVWVVVVKEEVSSAASLIDELTDLLPDGIAVFRGDDLPFRRFLFFTKELDGGDGALVRVRLNIAGDVRDTTVVDTATTINVAQGVGPASAFQASDDSECSGITEDMLIFLGDSSDRITAAYEIVDTTLSQLGGNTTIGLDAQVIASGCIEAEIVATTLSEESDDVAISRHQ